MAPPPPPLCRLCGVPLGGRAVSERCQTCARRPPAFAAARAAALYLPAAAGRNSVAAAVHNLKYRGRRHVAEALGALLAERYPFADRALLVPVPLHVRRLRARGFNQALLLARALGRRRGLAVAPRVLVRTRATLAQPGLAAAERLENVRDAFAVRAPGAVARRRVVLVDDVLTSGATAAACARALLAAGAARVDVYTVGRAP
jgi:ComF family protein